MNRPGPGPQPLRPVPGNMFQTQQNSAANRGAALGTTGRLQNGKMGAGSSWAFGGMNGAPGLSGAQARSNTGMSSFAQTIGGSQSHTPIDLSEFPSLSGTPQSQQHQNASSQALWNNPSPSIRLAQHTPVQRPQGQNTSTLGQNVQQSGQQNQAQPHDDGVSGNQSQYPGNGDDYRFGGQSGIGQLSSSAQPQTSNIDEFPPLGGGGSGEVGPDRRTSMIQNAAFGGLAQNRSSLTSPRETSGSVTENSVPRTQLEAMRAGSSSMQDLDRTINANQRSAQASFAGTPTSQLPIRGSQNQQQPIGARPQQPQSEQDFGGREVVGSPNPQQQQHQHKRLAEMTEMERFGLPGLLAMIPPDSPDHSSLVVGQDLTALGLDLNRPDNAPLYQTFGSPFIEKDTRPVIPEFTLPAAYSVNNVPPLASKMSSFSHETLLAIFYQYPRDVLQELAAHELHMRDWRWHKVLRQWMMKDPELPPPQRVSDKIERGWYIFFDVTNWRRERREFELNYDDLDQRHSQTLAGSTV